MTASVADRPPQRELTELARGGVIGFVGSAVAAVAGFLLTVVVARLLGPAQAGVFFVVVALFTILSEVTELGADTGLVRTAARLRALGRVRDLRRVVAGALGPVLAVSAVAAVGGYLAAPWLAAVFADADHVDEAVLFLHIAAPFLAVSAARTVALAGTRGLGNVAAYSMVNNVAMPVSRPVLAVLAVALGYGGGAVMLAWSLPVALAFVAAALILWRQLRHVEHAPRDLAVFARPVHDAAAPGGQKLQDHGEGVGGVWGFWGFAAPRGVAAVLEIAIVWLDVLIVGAMVSSHDAGIYATASRFITTGTLVLAATRIAVAPQIAGLLARGERRAAQDLNAVATGWVVAASWPLYLALACFGPFVLTLFGKGFVGGAPALAILCVSMLLVLAAGNVQTVLLMAGKSWWSLANKVIALTANVALNLVLIPRFGIVGAAVAWGLTMVVDTVLAAVQVRRLLGLRLGMRAISVTGTWALVWFGGLGLALRLVFGPSPVVFAGYLVAGCAGYGLVLWRLRAGLHADVLLAAVRRKRES